MKSRASWIAVLLLLSFSVSSHSQEMAAEKAPLKNGTKAGQRLPNNYGKLNLSDEQRQKIYTIQADYRSRINSLLNELEDLRSQESLEIQNTLTPAQQTELLKLLEASRQKREARKTKS